MKKISFVVLLLPLIVFGQIKPEMVFVKGGSFIMGNRYNDKLRKGDPDEYPAHEVKVRDFYIGKYEVTVKEYLEFLKDKSFNEFSQYRDHKLPPEPDSTWWQGHPETKRYYDARPEKWWGWKLNYPMFHVTWFDAVAYCNWLSEKEGLQKCYYLDEDGTIRCDFSKNGYRLPTEAEWEYAARGGRKSKGYRFSGSDNYAEVGWVDETTMLTGPRPVGTKKPNELGIYDMTGNVWEWCYDFYSSYYYKNSPVDFPVNERNTGYRVIRGGSWHYRPEYATVTSRDGPEPGYTNYNYGFRLVRTAK